MIPEEQYALAEAWASIDGKLESFHDPDDGKGHFEGYITEAGEMMARLEKRGFAIKAIR